MYDYVCMCARVSRPGSCHAEAAEAVVSRRWHSVFFQAHQTYRGFYIWSIYGYYMVNIWDNMWDNRWIIYG